MKIKKNLLIAIRLLLGTLFITTAVLKLFSLDYFEIYIYSFNLFSFVTTTIIARLLILLEFLMGGFLIFKIRYKETWLVTMAVMVGFTLFLTYVAIFRHDANCHCFGEFIELDPAKSIFKNLITIVLLFFIRKQSEVNYKGKKAIAVLIPSISFILTFVLFVPDLIYNQFISEQKGFDTTYFKEFETDTSLYAYIDNIEYENNIDSVTFDIKKEIFHLDSAKYIISFMTAKCKYCKLSTSKIYSIFKRNNIDPQNFIIWVWGKESSISTFIKEAKELNYQYFIISPLAAVQLTFGQFPTFIFVENRQVKKVFDYRGISETEIKEFLQ